MAEGFQAGATAGEALHRRATADLRCGWARGTLLCFGAGGKGGSNAPARLWSPPSSPPAPPLLLLPCTDPRYSGLPPCSHLSLICRYCAGNFKPEMPSMDELEPGTFYLAEVDARYRRIYARKPPPQ